MICEIYNLEMKVVAYVFDDSHYPVCRVSLMEFMLSTFFGVLIVLFMSWWFIPLRIVLNKADKINFSCKKERREKRERKEKEIR